MEVVKLFLIDAICERHETGGTCETSQTEVASRSSIAAVELHPSLLQTFVKGVVEVALDCAHRTSTFLSCAFCEQEGHLTTPGLPF